MIKASLSSNAHWFGTSSCDSNWLHVNAPEGSEAICCNNEAGGYEEAPCYTGMDLMPVLGSMQVSLINCGQVAWVFTMQC